MLFEKATRQKLKFNTPRGVLRTEDLWDLPLTQLNTLAKKLKKELKADAEEDFLADVSTEDATLKLMFDVVLYILTVKKDEKVARDNAQAKKAEKQKLLKLLGDAQDEELKKLTPAQLQAKIDALG